MFFFIYCAGLSVFEFPNTDGAAQQRPPWGVLLGFRKLAMSLEFGSWSFEGLLNIWSSFGSSVRKEWN